MPDANADTSKPIRIAWIEGVLILIILGLLVQICRGAMGLGAERAHRQACMNQLTDIAYSLQAYREKYGKSPSDLSELTRIGLITPSAFICPSDKSPGAAPHALGGKAPSLRCSYQSLIGSGRSKPPFLMICRHHRTRKDPNLALVLMTNGEVVLADYHSDGTFSVRR